jgi:hypothetical protein
LRNQGRAGSLVLNGLMAELQILATNLREGTIALGETENVVHWHPIDEIVELAAHWRDRDLL